MIRRPLFLLLSILVCAAIVAFLAYRPATVAGVHATELAKSLAGAAGRSAGVCRDLGNDKWQCTVRLDSKSSKRWRYRVHVKDRFGCWDAKRLGGPAKHLSGCITVTDYL